MFKTFCDFCGLKIDDRASSINANVGNAKAQRVFTNIMLILRRKKIKGLQQSVHLFFATNARIYFI